MNILSIFNYNRFSARTRIVTISCFIFLTLLFLSGCETYQRIQTLKAPRFETDTETYKGAKSCQQCHEEIYQQWIDSRHAGATGKWFTESVNAMSYFPTEMVMGRGMCYACHGPEELNEGVSCEVCHGINDQDDIEKVHEKKFSPGLTALRQSASCGKCHSNIDPLTEHVLDGALFEWQASQAAKDSLQCSDCHMKKTDDGLGFHSFDGRYMPLSLKLHQVEFKENLLSIVLENSNPAHSLPTGNASNVYRVSVILLNKENIQIAEFTKDIKKKFAMSFGFPAELIKDGTLKSGEIREITFPLSGIDKSQVKSIDLKVSHIEVDLDDDGEIKEIHRETLKLEKNKIKI
jgi:Cytochrome c554 and c-prime